MRCGVLHFAGPVSLCWLGFHPMVRRQTRLLVTRESFNNIQSKRDASDLDGWSRFVT